MPAPGKVVVLRPNGVPIEVTPEQAARLEVLGYKADTPQAHAERAAAAGAKDYYESDSQVSTTRVEGALSGLTLGGTDYLMGRNEDYRAEMGKRTEFNPGNRMASEVLGALVPLAFTGGSGAASSVARATPAGAATAAGKAFAVGAEGSLTRAVTAGAIEGTIYGGAGAASRAFIAGDPVTSETIQHGMGWGALFGGGLSAVGHGLGAAGKAAISKASAAKEAGAKVGKETVESANIRAGIGEAAQHEQQKWATAFTEHEAILAKGPIETAESKLTREAAGSAVIHEQQQFAQQVAEHEAMLAKRPTPGTLAEQVKVPHSQLHSEISTIAEQARAAIKVADATIDGTIDQIAMLGDDLGKAAGKGARPANYVRTQAQLKASLNGIKELVEANASVSNIEKAIVGYQNKIKDIYERVGVAMPSDDVAGAIRNMNQMRGVAKELAKFPRTPGEFATMKPPKAEALFAALEGAQKLNAFPNMQAGLDAAHGAYNTALGVEGKTLRDTWEAARGLYKLENSAPPPMPTAPSAGKFPKPQFEPTPKAPELPGSTHMPKAKLVGEEAAPGYAGPGMGRRVMANVAGLLGFKAGISAGPFVATAAAAAARSAVLGNSFRGALLAAKAGTVGRVESAAAKWAPAAGRATKKTAGIMAGIGVKLDGTPDTSTKDKQQLAANRVKEIMQAAPTMQDTIYRATAPLQATQPQLVPGLNNSMFASFTALAELMPKDPGAISAFKSLWKPSQLEAAVLDRQLAVFHNPIGEIENMLATNRFDPIGCEALAKTAPEAWRMLRSAVLARVTQPGVLDKSTRGDQMALTVILGIPMHSSMAPKNIAASQQIYTDRNQPLEMGATSPSGAGINKDTTSAQASAQR